VGTELIAVRTVAADLDRHWAEIVNADDAKIAADARLANSVQLGNRETMPQFDRVKPERKDLLHQGNAIALAIHIPVCGKSNHGEMGAWLIVYRAHRSSAAARPLTSADSILAGAT
jgi:hypothetical protein